MEETVEIVTVTTDMFAGITADSFMGVLNQCLSLVPKVFPAVIGFLSFRKGWSFATGAVRRA